MMVFRKPLSVGQAAKICRVSKKTVLNWIYRDALKAFTTYGGHYRIWPGDLKSFLTKSKMDIPFEYIDERQTSFLIVDDDPTYSFMLKEALLADFPQADVLVTDDGYEALLLVGERKPQIIILDLRMPKLDGFHFLELLKERKKDSTMKVLVVSGYLDDEARERLSHNDVDGAFDKVSDINEIMLTLRRLLESNHRGNGTTNQASLTRAI
jgi:excisionase family DNA binding protein